MYEPGILFLFLWSMETEFAPLSSTGAPRIPESSVEARRHRNTAAVRWST
jgi:hypothetical protein